MNWKVIERKRLWPKLRNQLWLKRLMKATKLLSQDSLCRSLPLESTYKHKYKENGELYHEWTGVKEGEEERQKRTNYGGRNK
jgi:hypothetical protein